MKALSSLDRIAFADLLDLCRDAPSAPTPGERRFRPNGTFIRQDRNGGTYWYYRGYERASGDVRGRSTLDYVGPVGVPEWDALATAHQRVNSDYRRRHELASHLRRAGLPAPSIMEGAVVETLSDARLLDGGPMMVGSVAFQTYGGLLGVRLAEAHYRTRDIDLAQSPSLAIAAAQIASDPLPGLVRVDPTFSPMFHAGQDLAIGYRNASGFKIEFLVSVASGRHAGNATRPFPGLPSVGAQEVRMLEFLLKDPVDSILLHDAGLRVPVPDPMRYAVHKLIVSVLRGRSDLRADTAVKSRKDVQQAATLIGAAPLAGRTMELGRVWLEAWHRGPRWKSTLREGTLKLDNEILECLAETVAEAATLEGLDDPFAGGSTARMALLGSAGSPKSRPVPRRPQPDIDNGS